MLCNILILLRYLQFLLASSQKISYNTFGPQILCASQVGQMPKLAERLIGELSSGAINPASLGTPEQAALYRFCRNAVSQKRAQIAEQVRIGRTRVARKKQNELLRSLPARVLASVTAIRKINRRRLDRPLSNERTIPFRRVWTLAERLRTGLAAPSFGIARLKPRRGNGFREVLMFEAFDVARQKLIVMSITPFVGLHSSQFMLMGGRTAACEALMAAMNTAPNGARFLHVDINDYHGSFSHDWLRENLPLSADIIQHAILLDGMRNVLRWHLGLAHQQNDEGTDGMGRRGIPQGSAASSIVAEYVMADILRAGAALLEGFSFFNYSDNLGILVPTGMDEPVFMERLSSVFQTHPAGPFHIRLVGSHDIREPFGFLGYHWQMRNGARAFVPEFVASLREMNFQRDLLEAETEEQLLRIEHSIRSYCAAFSLWEGAAAMQNRLLILTRDTLPI